MGEVAYLGFNLHLVARAEVGQHVLALFVAEFNGLAPELTYSHFIGELAAKGFVVARP